MKNQTYAVNKDAFSSGQIGSKIWLCEELEKLFDQIDQIWIYGGWYGLTAFLLRSRNNIKVKEIVSVDVDPECEPVADMINENWVYQQWQFKAMTADCNNLVPATADLVINTSTEHFESKSWFDKIPKGKTVVLQGNNMTHSDHHVHSASLKSFQKQYPMTQTLFAGQKDFEYPDWKFSRFMIIGIK